MRLLRRFAPRNDMYFLIFYEFMDSLFMRRIPLKRDINGLHSEITTT